MGEGIRTYLTDQARKLLKPLVNLLPENVLELNDRYKKYKREAGEKASESMTRGTQTRSKGRFFDAISYHMRGQYDKCEQSLDQAVALGEFQVIRGNKQRALVPKETAVEVRYAHEFIKHDPMLYEGLTERQCRVYDIATDVLREQGFPVRDILGHMKSKVLVSMTDAPTGHALALENPAALMPLLRNSVDFNKTLHDLLYKRLRGQFTVKYRLATKLSVALAAMGASLSQDLLETLYVLEEYQGKHASTIDTDCSIVNFFIHTGGQGGLAGLVAAWDKERNTPLMNARVRKSTIERFDLETFATETDTEHNRIDIIERTPHPLTKKEVDELDERHFAYFPAPDEGLLALVRSVRLTYISSELYRDRTVLVPHGAKQTAERMSALLSTKVKRRIIVPTLEGIAAGFFKHHYDLRDMATKG